MAEVRPPAAQASVIADRSVEGAQFGSLVIDDGSLPYACNRQEGDVLVTQGDSCVHIGPMRQIKYSAAPAAEGRC